MILDGQIAAEPEEHDKVDWEGILKSSKEKNKACIVEDLSKDPARFVINQLLLSYQFWTNFER